MVNQPHLPHSGPTIERIKYTLTHKKRIPQKSLFFSILFPRPIRYDS